MNRSFGGALLAVVILALVLRLAVAAITVGLSTPAEHEPSSDGRIHTTLAQNLLSGRGFSLSGFSLNESPTATTPPLYVFFLAGIRLIWPDPAFVRVIHAGLGALACLMIFEIGRRLFDATTGLLAAALLATSPHAIYISGLHLTENLFLIVLLLMLLQSVRVAARPTWGGTLLLGAMIGLTALTRALFLLFLPVMLVWAATSWGLRDRTALAVCAWLAIGAAATLAPWTARNAIVIGSPVPVQSNGGMVFWAGNNPHSTGGLVLPTPETWEAGNPPDDDYYGWRDLNVSEENRVYVSAALRWIRTHPRDFASLVAAKLTRLYGFTRAADGQSFSVPLGAKVYHVGFLLLGMVGAAMATARWRALFVPFALIIFVNTTVALFSGGTRYMIPLIPAFTLFAGSAMTSGSRALMRSMVRSRLSTEPSP